MGLCHIDAARTGHLFIFGCAAPATGVCTDRDNNAAGGEVADQRRAGNWFGQVLRVVGGKVLRVRLVNIERGGFLRSGKSALLKPVFTVIEAIKGLCTSALAMFFVC